MILFDTSAWIHYLNHEKLSFEAMQGIYTCLPIVQEVLQGIRSEPAFQVVKSGMNALPFLPVDRSITQAY